MHKWISYYTVTGSIIQVMICWYAEPNVTLVVSTTLLSNWLTHCMLLLNKHGIGMIHLYEVCVCVCACTHAHVQTFVDFGPMNGVDSCITPLFLSLLSAYSRTMERNLCSVEMTAVRAFSSLATITCLPSLPGICQSTIVLVAFMGYCTVIASNTHVNRMAN
jgi:hypothetical protein